MMMVERQDRGEGGMYGEIEERVEEKRRERRE